MQTKSTYFSCLAKVCALCMAGPSPLLLLVFSSLVMLENIGAV